MTIKSTLPTQDGRTAAVYTAAVPNRGGSFTDNIYTILLDEQKGKFHNIRSPCVVERLLLGTARYKSRAHAALLAQAEQLCQDWAKC